MRLEIRVFPCDGGNFNVVLREDETFQQFQARISHNFGVKLARELFQNNNNCVKEHENLASFLKNGKTDNSSETLVYEIRFDNFIQNPFMQVKKENEISNDPVEPNEYITFKNVPNFVPLINLNNEQNLFQYDLLKKQQNIILERDNAQNDVQSIILDHESSQNDTGMILNSSHVQNGVENIIINNDNAPQQVQNIIMSDDSQNQIQNMIINSDTPNQVQNIIMANDTQNQVKNMIINSETENLLINNDIKDKVQSLILNTDTQSGLQNIILTPDSHTNNQVQNILLNDENSHQENAVQIDPQNHVRHIIINGDPQNQVQNMMLSDDTQNQVQSMIISGDTQNQVQNMIITGDTQDQVQNIILNGNAQNQIQNILIKSENKEHLYSYMEIESKLREIHDTTEDVVSDFCRLCAKSLKQHEKVHIYNDSANLKDRINECLPIKVQMKDGLPAQTCMDCSSQLKGFADFIQMVLQADKVLRLKFMGTESLETSEKPVLATLNYKREENLLLSISQSLDLKCRFCHVPLSNTESSIEHSLQAHSKTSGLFICVLCELGFTEKQLLHNHVENKHRQFHCNVCLKTFNIQNHSCEKPNRIYVHCETCNKSFNSKERLNFHRKSHLKNSKPLFCTHCRISFKDENEYFDHVNFLHECNDFICDKCERIFATRNELIVHKKTHKNYTCEFCSKSFINKKTLQAHEVIHEDTKSFDCHICGRKLSRMSRLRRHLLTHESDPELFNVPGCVLCGEVFSSAVEAERHPEKHADAHCVETVGLDRAFRCEFCLKNFLSLQSFSTHRETHIGDNPYTCDICQTQFATYNKCTSHKAVIHGVKSEDDFQDNFSLVRHFLCEYCGKSYEQRHYLSLHRRLKHSKTHKCPDCYMEFLNAWGLNQHRRTNHHTEPVKCMDCGKYFANSKSLQIHMVAIHSDNKDKDFKCEKCSKSFAYKVSLEAHLKTHIKEYKCTKCPKSFLQPTALATHLRLHRAPNICQYCAKTFSTRSECEEHENLHRHKKLNCGFCDKSFSNQNQLLEHSKIHINRPHVCDICGLTFRKPLSLKNHLNRHLKSKNTGSFVLMVDMKEEPEDKPPEAPNLLEVNTPSENYIDIGNGNYLKVQGSTVHIDGKDYILLDEQGRALDGGVQLGVGADTMDNTMVLVQPQDQLMLTENQEQEYMFTEDANVKENTTYVIGNHFVLGSDDQVTF